MGSPCSTNQTAFTDPNLSTGDIIKDYHVNELKDAINKELARRSITGQNDTLTISVGDTVKRSDWLAVIDRINIINSSYTWNSGVKTDTLIKATHVNEIRQKLNAEEVACICDCNYCTCDCDYCTCDCDYCTCDCNYACTCDCNYTCSCDCNYCTCNCNHSCTCDCNYSDRRLKTEIVYF